MTVKPATAFYFCSIEHKELSGIFLGSFALPGEAPQWVGGQDGKPRQFRDPVQAELNAARVLLSKINKMRDPQRYTTKRDAVREKSKTYSYREPEAKQAHSVESVFGKRN